MESITVFFIVEIIGTVAFACSGAMVAIKKNLDLLGIIVLGVTTAVGGGMLRDILIGIHPAGPVYQSCLCDGRISCCPLSVSDY